MLAAPDDRRHNEYWDGADLVVEVVSGGIKDRQRDLIIKRDEYAQAGIPEYWIIDPEADLITVLHLGGETYVEYGQFGRGMSASFALLPDWQVSVDKVLDAGQV